MSDFTDKTLACRVLETRQRGYSLRLFYERSKPSYALLVLCFGIVIPGFAVEGLWPGAWIMLGVFIGILLRDIAWVRTAGKTWPFSVKVTDWDKVRRIAQDEHPEA